MPYKIALRSESLVFFFTAVSELRTKAHFHARGGLALARALSS